MFFLFFSGGSRFSHLGCQPIERVVPTSDTGTFWQKGIGGSRGACQAHAPLWDQILSFSHTFLLKSTHVGGPRPPPPPNGSTPPMGNPGSATERYAKTKELGLAGGAPPPGSANAFQEQKRKKTSRSTGNLCPKPISINLRNLTLFSAIYLSKSNF